MQPTYLSSTTKELSKLKNCPTDEELEAQIASTKQGVGARFLSVLSEHMTSVPKKIAQLTERLVPLHSGAPLISAEELVKIDADWAKWRQEWIRRRKVFMTSVLCSPLSLPDRQRLHRIQSPC
jgi:26S proteasome regulatory subunit (ATPase 3-interacting protein)